MAYLLARLRGTDVAYVASAITAVKTEKRQNKRKLALCDVRRPPPEDNLAGTLQGIILRTPCAMPGTNMHFVMPSLVLTGVGIRPPCALSGTCPWHLLCNVWD
eukprot:105695-Rhodomonas_salina.2